MAITASIPDRAKVFIFVTFIHLAIWWIERIADVVARDQCLFARTLPLTNVAFLFALAVVGVGVAVVVAVAVEPAVVVAVAPVTHGLQSAVKEGNAHFSGFLGTFERKLFVHV